MFCHSKLCYITPTSIKRFYSTVRNGSSLLPLTPSYFFCRYHSPELEGRDREQNEAPIIQGEILNELLWPVRLTQVHGAGQDPPKDTGRAGGSAHWAIFYHLSVLANSVGPSWLEISKYDSQLYKKGQKVDVGNFRLVSAREGYGADHPSPMAHTGQAGDGAQPVWAHERQVLLD